MKKICKSSASIDNPVPEDDADKSSNAASIKTYTHKELANLYGVSWPTLQIWLKRFEQNIGPKYGHFYTTKQVEIIFKHLGPPSL
jgi:transposase